MQRWALSCHHRACNEMRQICAPVAHDLSWLGRTGNATADEPLLAISVRDIQCAGAWQTRVLDSQSETNNFQQSGHTVGPKPTRPPTHRGSASLGPGGRLEFPGSGTLHTCGQLVECLTVTMLGRSDAQRVTSQLGRG